MAGDFEPIFHELPGRDVRVWAVADVHIGSRECRIADFEAFLKRVMADPDGYVVLCGDLINNGTKNSLTNVYEETIPPSEQVREAVRLLQPLADGGRILGVVSGNHEARTRKDVDIDPMHTICALLGIPHLYRQNMAFVRVNLDRNRSRNTYNLLLMHGKTANKKRHFAYAVEGIDVLVTGHTHDGIVEKPARLVFTQKGRVVVQELVSLTATSWLEYGGYGAAAMYLPKATANPQHVVLPFNKCNNTKLRVRVVW